MYHRCTKNLHLIKFSFSELSLNMTHIRFSRTVIGYLSLIDNSFMILGAVYFQPGPFILRLSRNIGFIFHQDISDFTKSQSISPRLNQFHQDIFDFTKIFSISPRVHPFHQVRISPRFSPRWVDPKKLFLKNPLEREQ